MTEEKKPSLFTRVKLFWDTHKGVRDVTLAALAAVVGAMAYRFQSPELLALYLAGRAAVARWIKAQGGPDIGTGTTPPAPQ